MKLDWLRADIASARRASALLVLLLACSMLANVTLAAFAMHMAGRERVVVVPPSINKTFWVESERVSAQVAIDVFHLEQESLLERFASDSLFRTFLQFNILHFYK